MIITLHIYITVWPAQLSFKQSYCVSDWDCVRQGRPKETRSTNDWAEKEVEGLALRTVTRGAADWHLWTYTSSHGQQRAYT